MIIGGRGQTKNDRSPGNCVAVSTTPLILKAIDAEDGKLIAQAHEATKQDAEKLLGVSVGKINFSANGLPIQ